MRNASLATVALLALAACSDVTSPGVEPAEAPPLTARGGRIVASFTCDQDMVKGTSRCYPVNPSLPDGLRGALILAGSDFSLLPWSTQYDAGSEIATHWRSIVNSLPQPIGTNDGITIDTIRAFVSAGPTVTGGTGTASVRNHDGIGTFTASNQRYWNAPEIIDGASPVMYGWQFDVDNTVTGWTYTVSLEAPVQFPYGWVTQGSQGQSIAVNGTSQWFAVHDDARGNRLSGVTFTWHSGDPSVATVSSTGLVTGVSVGTTRIYATSSSNGVVGSASVSVN